MMHYNVHKTFTGPHGAGAPVRDRLRSASFWETSCRPRWSPSTPPATGISLSKPKHSIGQCGHFLATSESCCEAISYFRTLGGKGLREASENAVLNANYLLSQLKDVLEVPHGDRCMHEFVASAKNLKAAPVITAMDIAKRLLD